MEAAGIGAAPATPVTNTESSTDQSVLTSDFETFLKMLTAQVQNQDPLNPMDSTAFAEQLATFSGVEQQVKTNSLLEAMVSQFSSNGMTEMAQWVGMEARTIAPAVFDGNPITISPTAPSEADQSFLVVRNAAGEVVQRTEIPLPGQPMLWAGVTETGDPMPVGNYSFSLDSYRDGNQLDQVGVEVYSRVTEVLSENGTNYLVLASGDRVTSDAVTALREPR